MSFRRVRDGALFLTGLLGVLHETVLTSLDRPDLLLLFAAMMGLPAFLGFDRGRGGEKEG